MKILIFVTKYPADANDSYLTSELADAWALAGHDVTVVAVEWLNADGPQVPRQLRFPSGVNVHFFPAVHVTRWGKTIERICRWGMTSIVVQRAIKKQFQSSSPFDVVVFFSPAFVLWRQVLNFVRRGTTSYLYITDFFPHAQLQMGLLPSGLPFYAARWIENNMIRRFKTLGTMSPQNSRYLKSRFQVDDNQRVVVDMLWGPGPIKIDGSRNQIRAEFDLPLDRRLLLFGGQLIEGRGIETIIAAAALAEAAGEPITFVIIGAGRLRPLVEAAAAQTPVHLRLLNPIERDKYLRLAAACDLGLVVTVPDTDVPTFPSKTIDYMRVGLPVMAAVEESTDYGDIISRLGIGTFVIAGDPATLLAAALDFMREPERLANASAACERASANEFNVERAARDILHHAVMK